MNFKILAWHVYAFYFSYLCIEFLIQILNPSSDIYRYYHTLIAFDDRYIIYYWMGVASAIVNIISLLPLYLFVCEIRWRIPFVFPLLLIARIITDLLGHYYELQFFKSNFFANQWFTIALIATVWLTIIPSYCAHIGYTFFRHKLFENSSLKN